MKVKDLLAALKGVNPELDTIGYCEDDDKLVFFNPVKVEVKEGEMMRSPDHKSRLRFGKSEASSPHLLIELTSDD
jgi:hypothetical protein